MEEIIVCVTRPRKMQNVCWANLLTHLWHANILTTLWDHTIEINRNIWNAGHEYGSIHAIMEILQDWESGSRSWCTGSFCCLSIIFCHFLLLFKLALIWSPHILFQCIAVDIRFLLTLFHEWAGNGVFWVWDLGHILHNTHSLACWNSAGEIENTTFKIIFHVFSATFIAICLSSNMPSK
jgi:hypothetical protein